MAPVEVHVAGVSKAFGRIRAVDEVTLAVRRGEFFTLLGPSGSGKTTLLRIIGGLERPSAGRVFIEGIDVTEVPPNRRPTSTVFQDLALFPHMTVGENVEYGLRLRAAPPAVRRERAERMLRLTHLEGFYHRNVNTLSGGQRQRVALARALVVEPKVLLLDEPLTGLDEKLREQMQEELTNLQRTLGTTFVAVTHNQEEALAMSTRVAVLRDGRLEQVGTPVDLYEQPRTEFVASFIGSANLIPGRAELHDGALVFAGSVRVPLAHASLTPGSVVVAVIRPERIRVGRRAADTGVSVPAEVLNRVYKGAMVEYDLRLRGGQVLRAQVPAKDLEEGLAAGVQTTIGWDPADIIVIMQENAATVESEGGEHGDGDGMSGHAGGGDRRQRKDGFW
ncbi:MAG TPA: ABC transporter ATP-binding protein [bacterium]|jgi:ABC-type Fe3+/spermidine/putrescine transport system ATPase subunit|nr:ABC transporter ATP-binding protein [bacterium]